MDARFAMLLISAILTGIIFVLSPSRCRHCGGKMENNGYGWRCEDCGKRN